MENKQLSERLVNYDLLRIIAAFLVVMLHLSVQYINKCPASFDEYVQWQQAIKLSTLSRLGVPIFIMLSGAFLLREEKNISLIHIFKRYIPKLILIYVFWSFFYSLAEQDFFESVSIVGFSDSWSMVNWNKFWIYFAKGHYHMWYLYMLAGLYLLTPLLKHISAQAPKNQIIYFVFLCVLITSITKLNQELWDINLLHVILSKLSISFFFGYIGYFMAGYLFSKYTPNWIVSIIIFFIGIFCFRFTYQETWLLNPMFGFDKPNLVFFSNYSPTVFLMSFSLFLFMTKLKFINNCNVNYGKIIWINLKKLITLLPKYMLVVYLVHPFIIKQCREASLLLSNESSWTLPKNTFIVFSISLIVSIVLIEAYQLALRIAFRLIRLVFKASKC